MDSRSPQAYATISTEVKQHNLKFGGAPASAVNDYNIPLYTHVDPGEVERVKAEHRKYAVELIALRGLIREKRDALRAQLAERAALLRKWRHYRCSNPLSPLFTAAIWRPRNRHT
ncbi:hypothetical protein ACF8EA_18295 [Pseudomonas sp. YQ_5]|uniref:hypothetical protein n=1 Tax=Pseudomonas sp. YQ_5 TaxID=3367229 RepID=UPI00370A32E0